MTLELILSRRVGESRDDKEKPREPKVKNIAGAFYYHENQKIVKHEQ